MIRRLKMKHIKDNKELDEIKEPEDLMSIERYLGSGAVKGLGAALAGRIVRKFKEDTFRINEEEPERLAEVKGISERKAREISSQVEEKKDMTLDELCSFSAYDSNLFDIYNKFYLLDGHVYFNFGKHKDKRTRDVDRRYVDWVCSLDDFPKSSLKILYDSLK